MEHWICESISNLFICFTEKKLFYRIEEHAEMFHKISDIKIYVALHNLFFFHLFLVQ